MRFKRLQDETQRTYVVVFDPGEEVVAGLTDFARQEHLTAAHFTAIGAFQDVTVGFFELERKQYRENPIDQQVEVLTLIGNVARHQGQPKIHAHVVVGTRDGTAYGGHLMRARVQPTLEVVLVESPAHLNRTIDEVTGLPLLDPQG